LQQGATKERRGEVELSKQHPLRKEGEKTLANTDVGVVLLRWLMSTDVSKRNLPKMSLGPVRAWAAANTRIERRDWIGEGSRE
jgi:hypothetical protein